MDSRRKLLLIQLLFLALPGFNLRAAEKPNIILILADDLGYECLGVNGGTSYSTPHLDQLAHGGVRFEHCYSQPLCTPTRVQIMTGQYNVRNYVKFGFLDPAQTTFAHHLKAAGYSTCIVGKWQLGNGPKAPQRFGFDESYLWQLTRRPPRYANPGLEINGKELDFGHGEYGPDLISNYAIDFINRHQDQPFFLYYPMMLTHAPFQPTPDSPDWDPAATGEKVNQHERHFGEMVNYMDKLVGRLISRLDELKLREKTLVIFVGDNGTGYGLSSTWNKIQVRGGKSQPIDAGMRVPMIVSQTGTTAVGKVVADLVDTTDFLPTLCEVAGAKVPSELTLDGQSFWSQCIGRSGEPRAWTYCWYAPNKGDDVDRPTEFARTHRFKLHRDGSYYEVDSSNYTERQMKQDALSPEALKALPLLQGALKRFENARPAILDVR